MPEWQRLHQNHDGLRQWEKVRRSRRSPEEMYTDGRMALGVMWETTCDIIPRRMAYARDVTPNMACNARDGRWSTRAKTDKNVTGPARQAYALPILRPPHQHFCRYACPYLRAHFQDHLLTSRSHPVHDDSHGVRQEDLVLDDSHLEEKYRRGLSRSVYMIAKVD